MRVWKEENLNSFMVSMQTGTATVKNSMEFPQKAKNVTVFLK